MIIPKVSSTSSTAWNDPKAQVVTGEVAPDGTVLSSSAATHGMADLDVPTLNIPTAPPPYVPYHSPAHYEKGEDDPDPDQHPYYNHYHDYEEEEEQHHHHQHHHHHHQGQYYPYQQWQHYQDPSDFHSSQTNDEVDESVHVSNTTDAEPPAVTNPIMNQEHGMEGQRQARAEEEKSEKEEDVISHLFPFLTLPTSPPTAPSTPRKEIPPTEVVLQQPFFIMDWLDELAANQDVYQLARLLQTPHKHPRQRSKSRSRRWRATSPEGPTRTTPTGTITEARSLSLLSRREPHGQDLSPPPLHRLRVDENESTVLSDPVTPESNHYTASTEGFEAPPTPKSSNRRRERRRRELRHNEREEDARSRRDLELPEMPVSPVRPQRLLFGSTQAVENAESSSMPEATGATKTTLPWNVQPKSKPSTTADEKRKKKRRNVLKRSLALGQGWNTKGLQKAQQGSWQDALSCWEVALEIRIPLLGPNHPDVANTYNNQGIAHGKLGQSDLAIQTLSLALDIRRQLAWRAVRQINCHYSSSVPHQEEMGQQRQNKHKGRHRQQQQQQQENDEDDGDVEEKTKAELGITPGQEEKEEENLRQRHSRNYIHYMQQIVTTMHNMANVHQQAGDCRTALRVFSEAKEECFTLLQYLSSTLTTTATKTTTSNERNNESDKETLATVRAMMARIFSAMGHVHYQEESWVEARDAYEEALEWYLTISTSTDATITTSNTTMANASFLSSHHDQATDPKSLSPPSFWQEIQELQEDLKELDAKIRLG